MDNLESLIANLAADDLHDGASRLALPAPDTLRFAKAADPLSMDEVRLAHIQRVLDHCGGNRVRAARLLGIGRTSLYRYLKREAGKLPAAQSTSAPSLSRMENCK